MARHRTFEAWMVHLDNICTDNIGLSIHDLPDQPFRDWYDDELTPAEALEIAFENEFPGISVLGDGRIIG